MRTGQLFGSVARVLPWRTLSCQALGAALAAPVGLVALRLGSGPAPIRLAVCGLAFAAAYLTVLRATGQLPPMREWVPRGRAAAAQQPVRIAA